MVILSIYSHPDRLTDRARRPISSWSSILLDYIVDVGFLHFSPQGLPENKGNIGVIVFVTMQATTYGVTSSIRRRGREKAETFLSTELRARL